MSERVSGMLNFSSDLSDLSQKLFASLSLETQAILCLLFKKQFYCVHVLDVLHQLRIGLDIHLVIELI